ncbi:MAG TPA: hypothetical protein VF653_05085, partial [Methylomirabilota bacterium]
MADDRHTFELIARHVIRATEPLIEAGTSFGAFKRLMARLGFDATSLPAPYAALGTRVQAAVTTLESFPASPSLTDLLGLLATGKGVFDAIQGLAGAPPPAGVDAGAYAAEIGERLFELLLTDYLAREATTAFHLLSTLNVIR